MLFCKLLWLRVTVDSLLGGGLNAVTDDRSVLQNIPVLSHKLYKCTVKPAAIPRVACEWSAWLTDYRKHVANETVYSNWKFATFCSARVRVIVNYHCGCHNFKTTALCEQTHHGVQRIRVKIFINFRIKFLVLKEGLTGRIRRAWITNITWRGKTLFASWWNGNGEDIFLALYDLAPWTLISEKEGSEENPRPGLTKEMPAGRMRPSRTVFAAIRHLNSFSNTVQQM